MGGGGGGVGGWVVFQLLRGRYFVLLLHGCCFENLRVPFIWDFHIKFWMCSVCCFLVVTVENHSYCRISLCLSLAVKGAIGLFN